MTRFTCFYVALLFLLTSVPVPVEAQEVEVARLPEPVARLIRQPRYEQAHWGLLAVDLENGQTVAQLHPNRLFGPASVTKLYSVAAAWLTFGPDHRFETVVYATGEIDEAGVLTGNLVLYPQGDLTLGGRTLPDGSIAYTNSDHIYAGGTSRTELTEVDPLQGLRQLAAQLRERGLRELKGDVVVDDRYFDPAHGTGSGPRQVTPVMVNDNLIDLVIIPGAVGEPARVRWRPKLAGFAIDNQVLTVSDRRATRVSMVVEGPYRVRLVGTIAQNQKPIVHVYEVPSPADFARALFIQVLRETGIRVTASPLARNRRSALPSVGERAALEPLARLASPPFVEEAKLVLKVSHNLHASALPILVAVKHGKRSLADGLLLQGQVLRELGVPVDTISLGSGAGGSRADCVSPAATVALLQQMYRRSDYEQFKRCLPILGVDGTLHDVIDPKHPAVGHVYAKTGTYYVHDGLNGRSLLTAKALAGYVETRGGRTLAFAVFVNRVPLKDLEIRHVSRDLARIAAELYEAF